MSQDYIPLATVTLASSASSVTFSSIPGTYRDLVLVANGTITSGADDMRIYYNADTNNANYSSVEMNGNGSTTASSTFLTAGAFSTDRAVVIVQIMDYSATDKHKTLLSRANRASAGSVGAIVNRWANTAAVTSVQARIVSVSFAAGTTLALYGIVA
jgi:hypothetical protein